MHYLPIMMRDKSKTLVLEGAEPEIPGIEIEIGQSNETVKIFVRRPELREGSLRQLLVLFEFQLARVQAEIDRQIVEVWESGGFAPGRFILGENFP